MVEKKIEIIFFYMVYMEEMFFQDFLLNYQNQWLFYLR